MILRRTNSRRSTAQLVVAAVVAALLVPVALVGLTAQAEDAATGAVEVPDSAYAIPSGARYVSPSGNDANAGTAAAPYRTVGKAVSATASGGTIVLRGGTYRETLGTVT